MKGLSNKEIEIVSWLEFHGKYFFTSSDIDRFAKNKAQRYNIVKSLLRKKRIIKLNRRKYYLVPIKAKSGSWAENPFVIVDEMCDSKDYFIGGWAASNHWKLSDQIPMRIDVYTTKRQGKTEVLNTNIVFHRTTKNRVEKSVKKSVQKHTFRILPKKESRKWMKSRS